MNRKERKIKPHFNQRWRQQTIRILLSQIIQSSHNYATYKARARPRMPATPARLMAIPPVAAGAPAVEVEEPPVVEAAAEPEELLSELEVEVDVVVVVMVEVTMEDEPEDPVRGVEEAPAVLLAPVKPMEPVMEPIVGMALP